jgi:2-polyprenyl-6-hydroxyphenyl methylase/3-demethylubiquinone-9 3-methyltransferase
MNAAEFYRDHYTDEQRAAEWCGGREPTFHRRLELVRRYISKGDRVLDYGCGTGALLAGGLDPSGATGVGYDISSSAIALARRLYPQLCWREGAVPLPEPDGSFSVIVSSEVIEHVFDTAALLADFARLLAPAGRLLLTTPYHGWLKDAGLLLSGRFERHYHDPYSEHIRYYSRRSLRQACARHGLREAAFHGIGRAPWLWRSMFVVFDKSRP